MSEMIDSRCGLHCTDCDFKESHGCEGCLETNGNPFCGECDLAICYQNKGFMHCGECPDIPCKHLVQYPNDPEHWNELARQRIERCKEWARIFPKNRK